jgi:uncharacterized protein (DUF4415 family)
MPFSTRDNRAHRTPVIRGQSRAARNAYERMVLDAYTEEVERFEGMYDLRDVIPEAWERLEKDIDLPERKTRVTIRLDESVAKFFRAQGPGYQRLVNRVLATYAHMKIAEVEPSERRLQRFHQSERDDIIRKNYGRPLLPGRDGENRGWAEDEGSAS